MLSFFNRDPNQPRLECWISNFTLCSPTNTFPNGILIHLNWILHFCADQKCYTFALHTGYIPQSSKKLDFTSTQRCIHELSSFFSHSSWIKTKHFLYFLHLTNYNFLHLKIVFDKNWDPKTMLVMQLFLPPPRASITVYTFLSSLCESTTKEKKT